MAGSQPRPAVRPGQRVGGQDEISARLEDPRHLGERTRTVIEVLDRADRHHHVERAVGERQRERVPLDESGTPAQSATEIQFTPGKIDANGPSSVPDGLTSPVAIATGDIQDGAPGQLTRPLQQRAHFTATNHMHLVTDIGHSLVT